MATAAIPPIPRHPTSFDKPTHKVAPAATSTARPAPQPSKPSSSDSFYGHEPTAKLCARFVTHLFACPDHAPPPTTAATSMGSTAPHPSPPLAVFIAYALHRTRLHQSVTFAGLYLLQRLKQRFPAARGSSGHRLFLSAFMIASKVICDDTYSNKSWCIVGQGMFALREVNQMEREMCSYLDWELNVDPDCLKEFEARLRRGFSGPGPYHSFALPVPTQKPAAEAITLASSVPPPWGSQSATSYPPAHAAPTATVTASSATRGASPPSAAHPTHAGYPSPPTTPDTPAASHSTTTSPASSVSPQTPPSIPGANTVEEAHAKLAHAVAPAPASLYSASAAAYDPPAAVLKAQAMARAMGYEKEREKEKREEKPKGKTFMLPGKGACDPFAFATPAYW